MKIVFPARAGFAGVAFAGLALSSSPATPSPPRVFHTSAARVYPTAFREQRLERHRAYAVAPTTCSTTGPDSFRGVSFANNIASGSDSAVLGGTNNSACDDFTGIGAGAYNSVAYNDEAQYSFIGGGANNVIVQEDAGIGSGFANEVTGSNGYVGAGVYGLASGNGSFVGAGGEEYFDAGASSAAGTGNIAGGDDSFVGAGDLNQIAVTGKGSFIGGGDYAYAATHATTAGNQISGTDSFVGAGDQNVVNGNEAFIGSGDINTISSAASYATILGGNRNDVTGEYASILGGFGNSASGAYAIVAGGDADSAAGTLSFAGGYHADAAHNGSFVWSDYSSGSAMLKDTAVNQFVVRASGGTHVYSNEAATSGVELAPGESTWESLSDRGAKTGIVPLDDDAVLAKVAALPISRWSYKSDRGVQHVGPMAQDFYAAFGTGVDDRHITSIDEDGVALAAIKALQSRLASLEARNAAMERRLDALASRKRE
jgi:trimeric autotransporter adhesin